LPFGVLAFASWDIIPLLGSSAALALGLPSPDPDRVITFRTIEKRPGWMSSIPRGRGVCVLP